MKTLINKANPQIRISAPEIERRKAMFYQDEHYCLIIKGLPWLDADDWTLVEEEPVDLEKELQAFLCNYDYVFDDDAPAYDIARHFYELGRKGGTTDYSKLDFIPEELDVIARNIFPDSKVTLTRGNTCLSCGKLQRNAFKGGVEWMAERAKLFYGGKGGSK